MFAALQMYGIQPVITTTTTTTSKQAGATTVTITYPPYSTLVATPMVAPSLPMYRSTPVYAYPTPIAAQPAYPYPFPVTTAPAAGVYPY
jgi:hypothetical protein